jgi:putative ABC transport system substrate-binding protein
MRRREFITLFGGAAIAWPLAALAQAKGKVWRIGMLEAASASMNAVNLDAFRRGLHELGYLEGQNLIIDYRSADGRPERLAQLAVELVRAKVDVIVPRGTPATQAARNATAAIPIVATIGSPVESGMVNSLARPGGNVTGLSTFTTALGAKRVELLKETIPGVARIGFLANLSNPDSVLAWKEAERGALALGVQAQLLDWRKSEDLAPAFDAASKQGVGAIVIVGYALAQLNLKLIVGLEAKHRLPVIYQAREFVDAGGLMSYGVSYPGLYYRAASLVDKIFRGAKPGDLPVEQPTKFELIINLKTAKALGLTIAPFLLYRADAVIE